MDEWSPPEPDDLPEDLIQLVKPELQPAERLLWASRARPKPEKTRRRSTPSSLYYATMFLAISFGVFSVFLGPLREMLVGVEGPLIVVGVLTAVVGVINVIVPIGRWIEHGSSGGQSKPNVYALTDRRAIIWFPQRAAGGVEVHAIARGSVVSVHRLEYPDGSGDVRFTFRQAPMSFSASGFAGVEDVRLVEELVRRTLIDPGLHLAT
jgi:hypothetical protein